MISDHVVYYTILLILLLKIMLGSKVDCQKYFKLKHISCEIVPYLSRSEVGVGGDVSLMHSTHHQAAPSGTLSVQEGRADKDTHRTRVLQWGCS